MGREDREAAPATSSHDRPSGSRTVSRERVTWDPPKHLQQARGRTLEQELRERSRGRSDSERRRSRSPNHIKSRRSRSRSRSPNPGAARPGAAAAPARSLTSSERAAVLALLVSTAAPQQPHLVASDPDARVLDTDPSFRPLLQPADGEKCLRLCITLLDGAPPLELVEGCLIHGWQSKHTTSQCDVLRRARAAYLEYAASRPAAAPRR